MAVPAIKKYRRIFAENSLKIHQCYKYFEKNLNITTGGTVSSILVLVSLVLHYLLLSLVGVFYLKHMRWLLVNPPLTVKNQISSIRQPES